MLIDNIRYEGQICELVRNFHRIFIFVFFEGTGNENTIVSALFYSEYLIQINDEVQITRDETTDFAILTNVDNEVDR